MAIFSIEGTVIKVSRQSNSNNLWFVSGKIEGVEVLTTVSNEENFSTKQEYKLALESLRTKYKISHRKRVNTVDMGSRVFVMHKVSSQNVIFIGGAEDFIIQAWNMAVENGDFVSLELDEAIDYVENCLGGDEYKVFSGVQELIR